MKIPGASATPSSFSRWTRRIPPGVFILPSVALILSAVMAWANVGFGDAFLARWGSGFLTSLVALAVVLLCLGALERQVDRVLASLPWVGRKLVLALLTTCAIETVLALAVTALNAPWDRSFGPAWWLTFSRSLPAGVLIGLFMSVYLKPKMDRMRQAATPAQA